jgi:hypothetical protein
MTATTEPWGRLVHDVAKYLARTARNVPDGAWDEELVAMLCADLYSDERVSQRFDRLAQTIERAQEREPAFAPIRALLAEIDELEAKVRAEDRQALARAAHLAVEIEDQIRTLARTHRKSP